MGRHSAPRSSAPLDPSRPLRTGPRRAQPVEPSQPLSRSALHGESLTSTAPRHCALHRAAHRRDEAARPETPNRAPLWRRSPAVPAAVAVLAVWGSTSLPQVMSAGHAGSGAPAASSELGHGALAAGGILGAAAGSGGGASATGSEPAASDASDPSDATTVIAAARLADRRVSRGDRTSLADPAAGTALKAPVRWAAVLRPAVVKPAAPAKAVETPTSRWVRPSAGGQSSCFCMRWGAMHNGIDLAGPDGSPIVAVGDGVVTEAGPAAGFGMWVAIRHANGDYSIYGHMYRYYVTVGQHVRAGQHIADIGANGRSTGPHLHFEIARGSATGPYLDPAAWLAERGVEVGPYNPDA